MLLRDKVIIVTGVGPGMGSQLALIAAAEGAKVALAARSAPFIDQVAQRIVAAGGQCITVPTDISDDAACDRLVSATLAAFGAIDGLVNSAFRPAAYLPLEETPLEAFQASMDVTCFGALRMAKAVLPAMKAKGGAIVNVSALAVLTGTLGQADYAVAKAALEGVTRQMAGEFGQYSIRVNAARMGWLWGAPVRDFLSRQAQAEGLSDEEMIARIAGGNALGIIPPEDDCAKTVLLFVSDYMRMVTGAVLDVNGGQRFLP